MNTTDRSATIVSSAGLALLLIASGAVPVSAQSPSEGAARAASRAGATADVSARSNQKVTQPPRIEDAYPLDSEAARSKTTALCQQLVVDLLATFNNYKEAHWNLNGPLYLVLHEYYQKQADYYRTEADVFAERALHVGYSIDGRYSTIAKTTKIPGMLPDYITDNESLQANIDRVTILEKEIYADIQALNNSDPVTANKLQDLAYQVDKNLWQLRMHLQKPGSEGQNLTWAPQQGQDRNSPK